MIVTRIHEFVWPQEGMFVHEMFRPLTIAPAVILGLVSGIAWFTIGEQLDDHMSNGLAWGVCPAVVPLLVSLAMLVGWRRPGAAAVSRSLTFFMCFYLAHWLPMGALLVLFLFSGARF